MVYIQINKLYFLVYENKVNEPDCIANFSKRKVFQDNLLKEIKYSHFKRTATLQVIVLG